MMSTYIIVMQYSIIVASLLHNMASLLCEAAVEHTLLNHNCERWHNGSDEAPNYNFVDKFPWAQQTCNDLQFQN